MRPVESEALNRAGFRHGFFTREGGISEGAYRSANFSYGVGDDSRHVDENFRRAEAALGLSPGRLVFLSQVHGNAVVELADGETRETARNLEGDAMVSRCEQLGLGVRTADCIPILIGDPATGCAAAVHAGWRGLVRGVILEAVRRMPSTQTLIAAVGPHIGVAAFEVSPDVAGELLDCSTARNPVSREYGSKPHVDLAQIAVAQLERAGVRSIDVLVGCTVSEPDRFFSFRRDGAKSGRHLSAIVPVAHDPQAI
jgi:YfiH family protein